MTEILKQKIEDGLKKLPREFAEIVNSSNWQNLSEEIGSKYLLNEDEIDDLQLETGLVLIGLVSPEQYAKNVENNIVISAEEALNISKEVFEKIFDPIFTSAEEKLGDKIKIAGSEELTENLNFILSGGDYSSN